MDFKNIIKLMAIAFVVTLLSCESMEDTYDEYDGDGAIRYTGKTSDEKIEAGWKRFKMTWKNSPDRLLAKTKIVWKWEGGKDSVFVDAGTTEYITKNNLENNNYEVSFYGVDVDGNLSLSNSVFAKPFTNDHEKVKSIMDLYENYYFFKNKLIVVLSKKNEAIKKSTITYTKDGKETVTEITDKMIESKYFVIEGIDKTKPITINRSANITECFDDINITPKVIDQNDINISSDMRDQLTDKYDFENLDVNWIKSVEELELDFSLMSIRDILYFKNLKTLHLGKNRYVHPFNKESFISKLIDNEPNEDEDNDDSDEDKPDVDNPSIFALKQLMSAGVKVKIYNNQFNVEDKLPSAIKISYDESKEIEKPDTKNWKISCKTGDQRAHQIESLLDLNVYTDWNPQDTTDKSREHHIIIDMKESNTIEGVYIRQSKDFLADLYELTPGKVQIRVSNDGEKWENPFIKDKKSIGRGIGEASILKFPKKENLRYVKLVVEDLPKKYNAGKKQVLLSDFLPF